MPYEIKKIKSGYKVCKMSDPDECFSKKPIPMKNAIKQKYAIEISERSKKGGADSDEEEEDEYDEEDEEIRNLFKAMNGVDKRRITQMTAISFFIDFIFVKPPNPN